MLRRDTATMDQYTTLRASYQAKTRRHYLSSRCGLHYNLMTGAILLLLMITTAQCSPKFRNNCRDDKPKVKEESIIGTFVHKVQAEDDSSNPETNITYEIVPKNLNKFTIDQEGEIKTNYVFDRDEPHNEKEFELTVLAYDPQKTIFDYCLLTVIIEDINDNPPEFDSHQEYLGNTPKDAVPERGEVMRILATDRDDGDNSLVYYSLSANKPKDDGFFRIDKKTGIIKLIKSIDKDDEKPVKYQFRLRAHATNPDGKQRAEIDVVITVIEREMEKPEFLNFPDKPIQVREDKELGGNITKISARSNSSDKLVFTLTNNKKFYTETLDSNSAMIKLASSLDYENETSYNILVKVESGDMTSAAKNLTINVVDVNDHKPMFVDVERGHVKEEEPPGTQVMLISMKDGDASKQFQKVNLSLEDGKEFEIEQLSDTSGIIKTRTTFDREKKSSYLINVIATQDGPPRYTVKQKYFIDIIDINDNPPKFTEHLYRKRIKEDSNLRLLVTKVKAKDDDSDSEIKYSIISGDVNKSFEIDENDGRISVNKRLDYETTPEFNLTVMAHDGKYNDTVQVIIELIDVNDENPVFDPYENIRLEEEKKYGGCILNVTASDRDTPNEEITFSLLDGEDFVDIETVKYNSYAVGCVKLKKGLDRDEGTGGKEEWEFHIRANDNGNPMLSAIANVTIELKNINDNDPFLKVNKSLWPENKEPGTIITLEARDYDEEENATFQYALDLSKDPGLKKMFNISGDKLNALRRFDRERKKSYELPIAITDNWDPPSTAVKIFTVIIADTNDNAMTDGSSDILVYDYKGQVKNMDIGRVYVNDPDDWDLPDKTFEWITNDQETFHLDRNTGMLQIRNVESELETGIHKLKFKVTENRTNVAEAQVTVGINVIPEEAIYQSASIRFHNVTEDQFIGIKEKGDKSKRQMMTEFLASKLQTKSEEVDVFAVFASPSNSSQLDVRFSIKRGSPRYLNKEEVEASVNQHRNQMENALGLKIERVGIDECYGKYCDNCCFNKIDTSKMNRIQTNLTSFIGVRAVTTAVCETCEQVRLTSPCTNKITFQGDGWALYPPFPSFRKANISLDFETKEKDGLIFYMGPASSNRSMGKGIQDFISLELRNSRPFLLASIENEIFKIELKESFANKENHQVDIILMDDKIKMKWIDSKPVEQKRISPSGKFNFDGPLQIGGVHMNITELAQGTNWATENQPHVMGFNGVIKSLTFNGQEYNIAEPSHSYRHITSCTFQGHIFYIILYLLICILIILIILGIIIMRRKQYEVLRSTSIDNYPQTLINYQDEDGESPPKTLIPLTNIPPPPYQLTYERYPTHKLSSSVDKMAFEESPPDYTLHWAYEGDEDSNGSLSSLGSGTDDSDIDFETLAFSLGDKFSTLAEMYKGDAE